MVRVAVDATPLLGDRTGIGVAVAGSVHALAKRPDVDLIGYGLSWRGRRQLAGSLPPGMDAARPGMVAGGLLRIWAHVDAPPVEWWTGPVDVVHGTNFVVPPARSAARLVTVNDLTPLRFPELCRPEALRYPGLVRRAVAAGSWVHTPSEFVAEEVTRLLDVPAGRVRVVPYGVANRGESASSPARRPSSRRYVLGLGTTEPRKDFPALVRAFDRIAGDHPDLDLRLAGPSGWGEEEVGAAIAGARHRDRIVRTGWVTDRQQLLDNAAVLAFPSLYEGFGFPPLEAMAAGVPVVATAAGAVTEVVGDAARLVPVGDVDALADALAGVLDDPTEAERLVASGRRRVARFDWDVVAGQFAALYEDVAAARRRNA